MKKLYLMYAFFLPMLPPWQSPLCASDCRNIGIVCVGASFVGTGIYQLNRPEIKSLEGVAAMIFIFAGICTMLNAENIVKDFDQLTKR